MCVSVLLINRLLYNVKMTSHVASQRNQNFHVFQYKITDVYYLDWAHIIFHQYYCLRVNRVQSAIVVVVVVVVVDINSPNVGTPRLRVEQIFNVTIRTKVLI